MNVVLENIPDCVSKLDNYFDNTSLNSTHDDLNDVDFLVASGINYHENYTVKMLKHIASYYGNNSTSRMKKKDIIDFIIEFEQYECNFEIVHKRRRLWNHMEELMEDNFTRKFIISMNT